jgi:hypothetical protein
LFKALGLRVNAEDEVIFQGLMVGNATFFSVGMLILRFCKSPAGSIGGGWGYGFGAGVCP